MGGGRWWVLWIMVSAKKFFLFGLDKWFCVMSFFYKFGPFFDKFGPMSVLVGFGIMSVLVGFGTM